jgi:hypothetical protein
MLNTIASGGKMRNLKCLITTCILGLLIVGMTDLAPSASRSAMAQGPSYEVDDAAVGCGTPDSLIKLGELLESGDRKATVQFGAINCKILKGKRVYIESSTTTHDTAEFCVRPVGETRCIWMLDRMLIV